MPRSSWLHPALPSRRALFASFALIGLCAGAISLSFGQSLNFHVFRQAAYDVVAGRDLYAKSADDYFKYSPTFALLFAPFAWLPPWAGAPLWSALNFVAAFFGIDGVVGTHRDKRIALAIALVGIVLATDGDQSNLLVAGAVLLALAAYERGRLFAGGALVSGATFVKIFPALGAAFALLTPRRARSLLALGATACLWLALPLLVLSPGALAAEYASWRRLLAWDHEHHGWCVMSVVQDGLRLDWPTAAIQGVGGSLQLLPIVAGMHFGTDVRWRRTLACALLVFSVLFNHRAEYASFALSAVALGVWYATSDRPTWLGLLVAVALVAPGPFFARADPSLGGPLAFLAAHRRFHLLRVMPLLASWLLMQRELLRAFIEVKISVRLRPAGAR